MNIIQQPDNLCFSGNVEDFILTGVTESIHFKLQVGNTIVIDEIYVPENGRVRINCKDVINELLTISVPSSDVDFLIQTDAVKVFKATLGNSVVNFTVVKGGIGNLEEISAVFMKTQWLTLQPQQKEIVYNQPEWLSYFGVVTAKVRVKAYLPNGIEDKYILDIKAGNLYTIDVSYLKMCAKFGQALGYYDVWVEDVNGNRLTYIQRYVLKIQDNFNIYLFENTLGGIDTVAFSGEFVEKVKTEGKIATILEESNDGDIDFEISYEQNTGFIPSLDYARWLLGFFVSKQKYHISDSIKRIYIRESENEFTVNSLNDYSFEFFHSHQTRYNYVIRNNENLPELIEFPEVDYEIPFLAPRLAEFPLAETADDLVLPAQFLYENKWRRISVASILHKAVGDVIGNVDLSKYWSKSEIKVIEQYLIVLGEKIKAAFADGAGDSLLWDGHKFADYLNQPVLTDSDVKFRKVTAEEVVEEIEQIVPAFQARILAGESPAELLNEVRDYVIGTLGSLENVDESWDITGNGKYLLENRDGIFYPVKSEDGTKITLSYVSPASTTVIHGDPAVMEYLFTSVDLTSGEETGAGTAVYTINDTRVATEVVQQGNVTFDCGKYLIAGDNTIKVTVTDAFGKSRSLTYTVSAVSLSISSPFDTFQAYSGAITFRYTPIGTVNKNVIFKVDGSVIATVPTAVNNRQLTQVIPAQSHGEHILEVYMEASIGESTARSNTLRYALACIVDGNKTPVIASAFNSSEVKQYATLAIPYMVYSPGSTTSDIVLQVNGEDINVLTVDRTRQVWNYRVDSPDSPLVLSIVLGSIRKSFTIPVEASSIDVEASTQDLELYLTSSGRSNNELNPAKWDNNGIPASLTGFNFATNGWVADENGIVALKVSGDARVEIPLKIFGKDFKGTGKTIEFEFETMEVADSDAVVINCMNGGRGLKITANSAIFSSEQVNVNTRFKDNERVRVSFVVEDRSGSRLVYTYINGIISGVSQYPVEDNFVQANPVNIIIGNGDCTVAIHNIRVYDAALNQFQMLDNYVADMDDMDMKIALYSNNKIFDDYGDIVYSLVLDRLPVMTIVGDLPSFKGDKKTVQVTHEDKQQPRNSFTSEGVQIDVQGTSSQYYPRKNYKTKHKEGFLITSTGERVINYPLREGSIAVNTFCEKADFAESSGTHNTGMAKIIDRVLKGLGILTPPQKQDERTRTTIDGFPIAIFHRQTPDSPRTFLGKYNFNNDKSTENTFGFSGSAECWEVLNNTSDRVLFKASDYTTRDADGVPEWLNDFEARYPDDDALNEQYASGKIPNNLKRLTDWIVSTSGNPGKFKAECGNYFDLDTLLLYYILTELFAMVDQRAKNMMLATWNGNTWYPIFYDNDTCLGINNEGAVAFGYNVESHDTEGTQNVFNGANSVLWNNVESSFAEEIATLYQRARSLDLLSYGNSISVLAGEQSDKWCEAIYNADSKFKYIDPLVEDGNGSYLYAAQGSRAEHRKWWLYNRFLYIDSKYVAGDFKNDFATMRLYTPTNWKGVAPDANFTITPYADSYVSVKFGSYLVGQRSYKGIPVNIVAPNIQFNDTETIVYGASRVASFGDLAAKYPGTVDVSKATMLSELVIGSGVEGYLNTNLTVLSVGSNRLLRKVDVRNCPNLTQPLDLSGCESIEEIHAQGTSITAVVLPSGGMLKQLHLPGTLRNLSLKNQISLADDNFSLAGIDNLSTIICENTPGIDSLGIVRKCLAKNTPVLERVRFTGVTWAASNLDILVKLSGLKGIDANGLNTDHSLVTGSCHVTTATEGKLASVRAAFPELTVTYSTLKPDTITTFVFSSSQGKSITNSTLECNFPFVKVNQTTYEVTAEDENTIKLTFKCDNHEDFSASYLVAGTRTQNYKVNYIPLRTIRVQVYGQSIYPVGAIVKIGNNTCKTDNNGYVYIRSGEAVEGTVSVLGYSGSTFSFGSITNDSTSTIYVYQAVEVKFVVKDNFGGFARGAQVTCMEESGTTNMYGECILNIGKGTWDYSVTKQDYFDYTGQVTVGTSATTVNVMIKLNVLQFKPEENGNIQMMLKGTNGSIVINSGTPDYIINWGDGSSTNAAGIGSQTYAHVYDTEGFYQVEIVGCKNIISCNGTKDCLIAYWSIGNSNVKNLSFGSFSCLSYVGNLFVNDLDRKSFNSCFSYCSQLASIPTGLFDNCSNVTSFNSCFSSCNQLTSIPIGLFDNCTKVTDFGSCFSSCSQLASIPTGLFDNCSNVTSFSYCFYNWTQLTSIPTGLFDNCSNMTSFNSCFSSCNQLTSIPISLFDNCTKVTDFGGCFSSCSQLISIPTGLFDNCPNVTSFNGCFSSCNQLTSIPIGLFDNCPNVTSFSYCFSYCSNVTSSLPPLWKLYYSKTITKSNCFSSCTKAENWLDVPASWGGTAPEYTPPALSGVVLADYRALDTRLKNVEERLNLN